MKRVKRTLKGVQSQLRGFASDQRAVTSIEYGVIGVCIALMLSLILVSDGAFQSAIRELLNVLTGEIDAITGGS
ncbi:Flp family type IVb pilin [Aliagarivorans taiwanensis]|uniref:Flp family type IVb pilin n=1 Tax=Aliagarivorans taiwanensis TaxID=561966 RepID=UPI00041B9379|nr:Flp family type IVb pilin [Aliagarivorans taiwanensis]